MAVKKLIKVDNCFLNLALRTFRQKLTVNKQISPNSLTSGSNHVTLVLPNIPGSRRSEFEISSVIVVFNDAFVTMGMIRPLEGSIVELQKSFSVLGGLTPQTRLGEVSSKVILRLNNAIGDIQDDGH